MVGHRRDRIHHLAHPAGPIARQGPRRVAGAVEQIERRFVADRQLAVFPGRLAPQQHAGDAVQQHIDGPAGDQHGLGPPLAAIDLAAGDPFDPVELGLVLGDRQQRRDRVAGQHPVVLVAPDVERVGNQSRDRAGAQVGQLALDPDQPAIFGRLAVGERRQQLLGLDEGQRADLDRILDIDDPVADVVGRLGQVRQRMAAPDAGPLLDQAGRVGHFAEQVELAGEDAVFHRMRPQGRRQHARPGVFGESAERGAGQLQPAVRLPAFEPGQQAEAEGIALEPGQLIGRLRRQACQDLGAERAGLPPGRDRLLALMAEGSLAHVMADRRPRHDMADVGGADVLDQAALDQILPGDLAQAAADARDFERMGQAVADIIARLIGMERRPMDLHLRLQPAKRAAEHEAIDIDLERRAVIVGPARGTLPQATGRQQLRPAHHFSSSIPKFTI